MEFDFFANINNKKGKETRIVIKENIQGIPTYGLEFNT